MMNESATNKYHFCLHGIRTLTSVSLYGQEWLGDGHNDQNHDSSFAHCHNDENHLNAMECIHRDPKHLSG